MKGYSKEDVMKQVTMITNDDGVFIIQVFVPCGSIHEKEGEYGISHFLEHIKFNKSKSLKVLELKGKLDDLGGKFNAYTSRDHTSYFIKTTSEQTSDSIELMFELVFNTQFSDNNLETERKVILEERESTRLMSRGFDVIMETVLKSSNPYRRSIIGKKKDLLKISNTDLKRYNDEHYTWDNVRVLISCPKSMRKKVIDMVCKNVKQVCKMENRSSSKRNGGWLLNCSNYDKFDYGLTVNKVMSDDTKILICFKGWSIRSPDHYLLHFISHLISNNFSSLLFRELREKRGAVYSVKMVNSCFINVGISTIMFSTTQKKYVEIVEQVLSTLKSRLKEGGIGEKEFHKGKKRYLRTLKYLFTNHAFVMDYYGELIFNGHSQFVELTPASLISKIERLEFDEFVCVCNRLFDFDQMGLYVKGGQMKTVEEGILNIKNTLDKFKQR